MELEDKRTVLAFVRGEATWDTLTRLGLVRSAREDQVNFTVPANFPVVRPTIADVAAGLTSQEGTRQQEWASALLALNVDLAALELDTRGAALVDAIWDAARGEISEEELNLARAVLTGPSRQH
jgi:hypothetical protein